MANFSSYIIINNQSKTANLLNADPVATNGSFAKAPTTNVNCGDHTAFQNEDPDGPTGSEGSVTYESSEGGTIKFSWSCPVGSDNNYFKLDNGTELILNWYGSTAGAAKSNYEYTQLNKDKYEGEGQLDSSNHPICVLAVLTDAPS